MKWFLAFLLLSAASVQAASQPEIGIFNPTEPAPTNLYFHINGISDFPINTQLPEDRYLQAENLGLLGISQGCVGEPLPGLVSRTHHTFYGYSSASYVQYEFDEGGQPRYHAERGIAYDVELGNRTPVVTWYLESRLARGDGDPVNPNQAPAITPRVFVRATVREGDDISIGHTELNTGAVIASGQTATVDLAGPLTNYPADGSVFDAGINPGTGAQVYGFRVEAPLEKTTINKDEAFNVRIDVSMDVPCGSNHDEYVMLDSVRVHTSPELRPHLSWDVLNPLRIEAIGPSFTAGGAQIAAVISSPWGSYDVRGDKADEMANGLSLTITGPSEAKSVALTNLISRVHEADHHNDPVLATWLWNFTADEAQRGQYFATVVAQNDQETATARAVAAFHIGNGNTESCNLRDGRATCTTTLQDAGQQVPAIRLPLVGLLLLALARRR